MSIYLTVEEVLILHDYLINEFGGSKGIANIRALESALMRPQSGYYKDLYEQSAALMESLAMNHPFVDGNKRVAFFATDVFLRLNGYQIQCDNLIAYDFLINLFESNKFNFNNLLPWMRKHITESHL